VELVAVGQSFCRIGWHGAAAQCFKIVITAAIDEHRSTGVVCKCECHGYFAPFRASSSRSIVSHTSASVREALTAMGPLIY
jgi:hypothetical protein